jgi:molecular chaperone GrpE
VGGDDSRKNNPADEIQFEGALSGGADTAELTADQEMEMVRTELSEARDKMLRAQAELDNYRKRARRELEDERRYSEIDLIRDLLPVLDNISRAVDAAEKKADAASLLEGIKLVRQQLGSLLERHHCKTIDAEGKPFDPAHHEAVMQQPAADKPENTVTMVVQTGYQLHDRVVRPAQVIVSKKP